MFHHCYTTEHEQQIRATERPQQNAVGKNAKPLTLRRPAHLVALYPALLSSPVLMAACRWAVETQLVIMYFCLFVCLSHML